MNITEICYFFLPDGKNLGDYLLKNTAFLKQIYANGHYRLYSDITEIFQIEFVIEDTTNGVFTIRMWWSADGYYFIRMKGNGNLQFGFWERSRGEYIYNTLS